MVIDVHVHPTGYPYVDHSPEADDFRDRVFQRRREAALAAPIAMTGKPSGGNGGGKRNFEVTFTQMDSFGFDRLVLMPLDLTTTHGGWIVSNDEIVLRAEQEASAIIKEARAKAQDTRLKSSEEASRMLSDVEETFRAMLKDVKRLKNDVTQN